MGSGSERLKPQASNLPRPAPSAPSIANSPPGRVNFPTAVVNDQTRPRVLAYVRARPAVRQPAAP